MSEIGFCSISWEWMDRIWPNFVYTLSLTRSMFVLERVIFYKFATELQPLIDVRNCFLLNILRMDRQNLTKFCIPIIIDKIYVAIVKRHFSQICNRVTALGWCQNFFLFNILRMDGQNLTKFCIPIIIDKIYVAIVKHHFSQICNRVSALDWCQKLVFAQYLENGWTEWDQILYTLYH